MSIQFACSCGQQLAAREEHAGKRVKCTACGEVQTVPGGARELPPTRALAPEFIQFQCSCGQICQARPEFAGRSTRCPRCSTVLTIPAGGITGAAPAAPRPASVRANEPVARVSDRRPAYDEEDEDDLDDRPRRRRRSVKKSKAWVWIAVAAGVLLLVGGGIGLWLLLSGGVSSDFDLVPRDAQAFVTIRVADALDSPLGKKMMDKLGKDPLNPLEEFEKKAGLTRKDIERVTVVFMDFKNPDGWVIFHTTKQYDKDKIRSAVEAEGVTFQEKTYDGKQYYLSGRDKGALCFHSDKVIVFASSAKLMEKCLDLPKKPKSGPLDEALEAASKKRNQFAAGINVPSDEVAKLRKMGNEKGGAEALAMFKALLEVKTAYMTAAVREDIECELGLTFPDKQKAKDAEETINNLLGTAKALLPVIEASLKQQGLGNGKEIAAEARKQIDQLKPKQSGKMVTLNWKFEGKALLDAIDMGLKQGLGQFRR